ncbi:MAG: hypothetical protein ACYDCL_09445 [Myxococcales bacterium]
MSPLPSKILPLAALAATLLAPARGRAMATHSVGALHHTAYSPVLSRVRPAPPTLLARVEAHPGLGRPAAARHPFFHARPAVKLAAKLRK